MSKRTPLVYVVSRMDSICERYAAGCTKTEPKILQVKRGQKQRNAPGKARKGRNRVRFGCWRGWEQLRTGKTRCEKPKFEPKRTPFPCTTCKKKPGRNTVFPPGLWQGQKDLVSAAASVGSRQSATGAHSPHDTHCAGRSRASLPNPTAH